MYGLYSAYGGKLSKIYWWLFRNIPLVRAINAVKEGELGFPYAQIKVLEKNNSIMSFNMGSPGVENKISILGYDRVIAKPFFAKFSQKPKAIELSRNELVILNELQYSGLVPQIYDSSITQDVVFFKTEYVKGTRPESIVIDSGILEMLILLSAHSLQHTETHELQQCLSHGDFCPWNLLVENDKLRLIDWEMAANRPLGYDLFTYIFQPAFLLSPQKSSEEVLEANKNWIVEYFTHFNISEWKPYLANFVEHKLTEEIKKQNQKLINHYLELQELSI